MESGPPSNPQQPKPKLTIVIPAHNEEAALERILPRLVAISGVEVIVVDGASTDRTAGIASRFQARLVASKRGRGAQLDAGARAAQSATLLFLHADATPPEGFPDLIEQTLATPGVVMGAFTLGFDSRDIWYRFLERATGWRIGLTGTPYGDQGLFLRAANYARLDGFPSWPLLEDVALVRRLRRSGRRVTVRPERMVVSIRRYRKSGKLRTVVRNRLAATLWALHVPAPLIWRAIGLRENFGSFGDR